MFKDKKNDSGYLENPGFFWDFAHFRPGNHRIPFPTGPLSAVSGNRIQFHKNPETFFLSVKTKKTLHIRIPKSAPVFFGAIYEGVLNKIQRKRGRAGVPVFFGAIYENPVFFRDSGVSAILALVFFLQTLNAIPQFIFGTPYCIIFILFFM